MIWQLCRRDCRFAASCANLAQTSLAVAMLLLLAHGTSLGCQRARALNHLSALTEGCNSPCIILHQSLDGTSRLLELLWKTATDSASCRIQSQLHYKDKSVVEIADPIIGITDITTLSLGLYGYTTTWQHAPSKTMMLSDFTIYAAQTMPMSMVDCGGRCCRTPQHVTTQQRQNKWLRAGPRFSCLPWLPFVLACRGSCAAAEGA